MKAMLMAATLVLGAGVAGATTAVPDATLANKVVHEIRMYPYYSIWDNVNVRVEGGHVELLGAVNQPWKKTDLGRAVQRVPGVVSVANDLKVLPLSNFDDRLRLQVARAIYGDPTLTRYAIQPLPPIHIIVENGHVTLEGVVSTSTDKEIAGLRANMAGLSFGNVTNNLRVENPGSKKG